MGKSESSSSYDFALGGVPPTKDQVLNAGAATIQNFAPVKSICAHLNAFHVYASDTSRTVEANHYCTHLGANIRQCLIYDSPTNPAKLIGVEYLITRQLYDALSQEEKKLWHSHDYEVRDRELFPEGVWEIAETAEMREVVGLYGKTFHFWQVDRGDELPLGMPELMMSFTKDEQVPWDKIKDRDERFGIDSTKKRHTRSDIPPVPPHQDADSCWK
ncbi:hypothetical protein V494_00877 [Pseudogymnoascus sp. VKM F-4513 (FW-928)]|nr:hypothetical protein V494_00877 [Pseudogymnoascus sp. VKM F-4513 (FW-928)]